MSADRKENENSALDFGDAIDVSSSNIGSYTAELTEVVNYTEDDLPYFRTLHSLAFRKLGLKKDQVMQARHYKDLGKKLGFPVTYADYQEDQGGIFTSDSEYLLIIQLEQLLNITPEQQFDLQEHTQDLERDQLRIIHNELGRYKKEYKSIDC